MIPPSAIVLLAFVAGAACRTAGGDSSSPTLVQPGAPGEATQDIAAARATDLSRVSFTPADVEFMQGMMGHHAQALDMTALIPSRTSRDQMRLLGRRIELSQADEIKMMQDWLQARGQAVPGAHAHHAHDYKPMPGMLSAEEMAQLAAATGAEFDRLFLIGMIKHHDGALFMVEELFKNPGAAQESEVFAFVSDVVADQRMEIDRMGGMLKEFEK